MPDADSIELSKMRLIKAQREHMAAQVNVDAGYFDVANTRAYYTAFHAIRAVLALEGVDFKTHKQTIGYFNEHYIHQGIFNHEYGKIITSASTSRTKCDYEDRYEATREEADQNIVNTGKFLAAVERYVEAILETECIGDTKLSNYEGFELDSEYEDDDYDDFL